MKRKMAFCLAGILLLSLLAGCSDSDGQDPDQEATLKPEYRVPPETTTKYLASQNADTVSGIQAPETAALEFPLYDGEESLSLNLKISLPETEQMYTVKTGTQAFDEEFAKRLAEAAAPDVAWKWDGEAGELKKRIKSGREEDDSWDDIGAYAVGTQGDETYQLSVVNYVGKNGETAAKAQFKRYYTVDGIENVMYDYDEFRADLSQFYFQCLGESDWEDTLKKQFEDGYAQKTTALSKPAARKQAEAFVEKLGLSDFEATDIREAFQYILKYVPSSNESYDGRIDWKDFRKAWYIRFEKKMEGSSFFPYKESEMAREEKWDARMKFRESEELRLERLALEKGVSVEELGGFREFPFYWTLTPEEMYVVVGDEGIMEFGYSTPLADLEEAKEPAKLLTWGEITKILEQNSAEISQTLYHDPVKPDCAQLGYCTQASPTNQTYYVTPVWDFYDTQDENRTSILTINAVNGSIIYR